MNKRGSWKMSRSAKTHRKHLRRGGEFTTRLNRPRTLPNLRIQNNKCNLASLTPDDGDLSQSVAGLWGGNTTYYPRSQRCESLFCMEVATERGDSAGVRAPLPDGHGAEPVVQLLDSPVRIGERAVHIVPLDSGDRVVRALSGYSPRPRVGGMGGHV